MRLTSHLPLACLVAGLLSVGSPARADDGAAMAAAAKRFGPSLVRVEARVYLEVAGLPGVGKAGRRSHQVSFAGVVVDAKGLVAFPSAKLDPVAAAFALLGTKATASITWIRVVGADGRVRDARWVGRDPKSGFGFARVAASGLEGLAPVTWAAAQNATLGEPILVLTRTGALLKYAPRVDLARIASGGAPAGITPVLPHALGGLVVGARGAIGLLAPLPNLPEGDLLRPDRVAEARAGYVVGGAVLAPLIKAPPVEEVRRGPRRKAGRAWLGIRAEVLTAEIAQRHGLSIEVGVRVAEVYEGPAKVGGLKTGDVLLKMDGEPLDLDPGERLEDLVEDYAVGETLAFLVHRGGKNQLQKITLGPGPVRPVDAERARLAELGLVLRALTFSDRKAAGVAGKAQGAVVVDLAADGAGSRAGLRVGDIILGIGDSPAKGLSDLRQQLLAKGTHALKVRRRGKELTLRVRR